MDVRHTDSMYNMDVIFNLCVCERIVNIISLN
jgi:hypothetical protein